MIDVFIGTLKDSIKDKVRLWEHDSLENAYRLAGKVEKKIMVIRKSTTHNYKDGGVISSHLLQPTRLTPQHLEEEREKGLFYSCDKK